MSHDSLPYSAETSKSLERFTNWILVPLLWPETLLRFLAVVGTFLLTEEWDYTKSLIYNAAWGRTHSKLALRISCTKISLERCLAGCLAHSPCTIVADVDRVRLDVHLLRNANRSTNNGVNKNLGLNDLYKDYSYFPMILHTTELTEVY